MCVVCNFGIKFSFISLRSSATTTAALFCCIDIRQLISPLVSWSEVHKFAPHSSPIEKSLERWTRKTPSKSHIFLSRLDLLCELTFFIRFFTASCDRTPVSSDFGTLEGAFVVRLWFSVVDFDFDGKRLRSMTYCYKEFVGMSFPAETIQSSARTWRDSHPAQNANTWSNCEQA